jgi:hypothetical protein
VNSDLLTADVFKGLKESTTVQALGFICQRLSTAQFE